MTAPGEEGVLGLKFFLVIFLVNVFSGILFKLQVDMQLVCFAVNYVGSAMAKTRLKTSSASEIGVTGEVALPKAKFS